MASRFPEPHDDGLDSLPEIPEPPPQIDVGIPDLEIIQEIARGGMGIVYFARIKTTGAMLALKILKDDVLRSDPEYLERFHREARLHISLGHHPNLVRCYQSGIAPTGEPFLVLEYVDGPDLTNYVAASGPLQELPAIELMRDVLRALEFAHRPPHRIIHRDVKADNVLLAPRRRMAPNAHLPFVGKLADLGLAKPLIETLTPVTRVGDLPPVTISTMAPEQIQDPLGIDFRVDIYGAGCVLYHALTGRRTFPNTPWEAVLRMKTRDPLPDPRVVNPAISKTCVELIHAMIAPRREDRPQTAADAMAACDDILAGRGLRPARSRSVSLQVPLPDSRPSPRPLREWLADLARGMGLSSTSAASPGRQRVALADTTRLPIR